MSDPTKQLFDHFYTKHRYSHWSLFVLCTLWCVLLGVLLLAAFQS